MLMRSSMYKENNLLAPEPSLCSLSEVSQSPRRKRAHLQTQVKIQAMFLQALLTLFFLLAKDAEMSHLYEHYMNALC